MSINDITNLNSYNSDLLQPLNSELEDPLYQKPYKSSNLPNYGLDTLVFVDSLVQDYGQILSNLSSSVGVVVLDSHFDGIGQIGEVLKNYHDISAVHIISHGSEGTVKLGTTTLSDSNLSLYEEQIKEWGTALTQTGDILFYGCNVAQGQDGQAFVTQLSQFTEADVAASTDTTGASSLGGDWTLEFQTGAITATTIQDNTYNHLLDTPPDIWTLQELYDAWQDGNPDDFTIADAELTVSDNVFLSGTFSVSSSDSSKLKLSATNLNSFTGYGAATTDTSDDVGLALNNIHLNFELAADKTFTYAIDTLGSSNPAIELRGIPDLTLAVNNFTAQGNASGTAVTLTGYELGVSDFASLSGDELIFNLEKQNGESKLTLGADGVSAFVGSEYGTTDAVGIEISDGELGLILTSAGKYALTASGNTSLVGVNQLTLDGRLELAVNRLGTAVNQTITLPSGEEVIVNFGADDITRVQGNANIDVAGFAAVSGEFFVEKTVNAETTKLLIAGNDVTAFVGSNYQTDNATGILLSDGKLGLVINRTGVEAAEYALQASASAGIVGVDELTLEGTLNLAVNRSNAAVNQTISLPSGQTVTVNFAENESNITRVQGNADIDVAGFAAVSGEFFVEKNISVDVTQLLIAANDVTAFVGSGYESASETGIKITDGKLGLIINQTGTTPANYALNASGSAEIVGINDLTLEGILAVAVNRTGEAVDTIITLPSDEEVIVKFAENEGNITRIQGNANLNVADFVDISGEFFIEKQVTSGDSQQTQLLIAANDVTAFVGSDTGKGVQIDDGKLGLVIEKTDTNSATYALTASGSAELVGVPELTLAGDLQVEVNRMGGAVAKTITLPSGETIDIAFTQAENNITRVQGNAQLNVADAAIVSGQFFFEKTIDVDNAVTQLRIGADDVTAFVGSNYNTNDVVGVELSEGQLGLVINDDGTNPVAYALTAGGNAELLGVPGLTLSGNLQLEINRTGGEFADSITLPSGEQVNIDFSYSEGDITRVQGNALLNIADTTIVSGEFLFEKNVVGNLTELRIGADDVSAFVGSGGGTSEAVGVQLSDGTLGLLINQDGVNAAKYALSASGSAALLGVPELTIDGTLHLDINRMDAAVSDTITLPSGAEVTLEFATGDELTQITGELDLNVADKVQISGDFGFQKQVRTEGATTYTDLLIGADNARAFVGSGGDSGIEVTNGELGLVIYGEENNNPNESNYALVTSGKATLVGIPDLTLAADASIRINRTGKIVDETIPVGVNNDSVEVVFNAGQENQTRIEGIGHFNAADAVAFGGAFSVELFKEKEIGETELSEDVILGNISQQFGQTAITEPIYQTLLAQLRTQKDTLTLNNSTIQGITATVDGWAFNENNVDFFK